jgi:hypothetical protein
MEPIKGNPREFFAQHRERGPKRFEYTYAEIAAAAKQSLATVRSQVKGTFLGLRRVALYVARGLGRQAQQLDEGELRVLFGVDYAKWEQRWPRFDLYHCANPDCPVVVFHRGLCANCGGPTPAPIAFDAHGYVAVYLGGKYVPWHRFVLPTPDGCDVHHHDRNKWNNLLSNLEGLPHPLHFQQHHKASVEKPSLTIKKAHDTVEDATTTEGEPAVAGVSP